MSGASGTGGTRGSAEGPVGHSSRKRRPQTKTSRLLQAQAGRIDWQGFRQDKHLDIVAFNDTAEQAFVELVRQLIEESQHDEVPLTHVLRECAFGLNVSVTTVKRYVMKHTARRAELRIHGKGISLNPYYHPPVEDDEGEGEEAP